MKAIILTRVSTKMQEEGLSLLAQNNRLHEYAERKGLEIIKSFEIVESSTRGERKQFMEMINFCKKQRECYGRISTLGRDDFISLLTELTILSNFYKNYENYDFSNIKELNSRNINNNEQKIEYVKKLKFRKNNDVIQERFNSKKYEDESDIILDKDDLADKVGKEAKKKPARKNKANSKKLYIMPQDLCIDCSKYPKVNKLLTEMQELDLNRYHAVVSTSFRSLAEYTAKCYKIKVQGGNKDEIYSASTNLNGLCFILIYILI